MVTPLGVLPVLAINTLELMLAGSLTSILRSFPPEKSLTTNTSPSALDWLPMPLRKTTLPGLCMPSEAPVVTSYALMALLWMVNNVVPMTSMP